MKSKEALEIIGVNTDYKDYSNETIYNVNEAFRLLEDSIERLEELEKENKKLKQLVEVLEKYACKYKSLISGQLWRDGKERTKWYNKIRNQKDWIDYLSKLREYESNDEEQFLRVVNHLDTQVLYWALLSLEQEIKRYSEEVKENENFL